MKFNWNIDLLDSVNWKKFTAKCNERTVEENRHYHTLVALSFEELIHMGIWRSVDDNKEPIQFMPIHHMEPTNRSRALHNAKNTNNYLIISALKFADSIIRQKANDTISTSNKINKTETKMNTTKNNAIEQAVPSKTDVTENKVEAPVYELDQKLTIAGKDCKIKQVIITVSQESRNKSGKYQVFYRYRKLQNESDNSALYSQQDMMSMVSRAERVSKKRAKKKDTVTQRNTTQLYNAGETYGKIYISDHKVVFSSGKKKDGTVFTSDKIIGHRYNITTDGGKTHTSLTQTQLTSAIKRELAADKRAEDVQSELAFDARPSEMSTLLAENAKLKQMIEEIHRKLNISSVVATQS